jgi:hypothetical protein
MEKKMSKVIVIGGGAAGMMAAIAASSVGHQVILLEQNEKLGKKVFITGKGRCNFTNAAPMDEVMDAVITNPKFLYSAFYTFSNEAVMDFFEREGMPYKIERGNRVFPVSDHSSDVIRCLERVLKKQHVQVRLHTAVKQLLQQDGQITGVLLSDGERLLADNVILATGGRSYPSTGSTGDGYRLAAEAGHALTEQRAALVPLATKEDYCKEMQGLSLKNVTLTVYRGSRQIYQNFGEMLFTHFGISGPLVLSASSYVSRFLPGELRAEIDLKPALTEAVLDERLQRELKEYPKSHSKAIYQRLLPAKMIPVMMQLSEIDENKSASEITKAERLRMVSLLKAFPLTIVAARGWNEAIITQGGVSVKEVDPSTMESKRVKGLYFAGEVLDLDALTGGFNLQIAWSTGYLAGISIR